MKAKSILMSVLAAGCLSVACFAEAASVALLPLIDNSSNEKHEEINATFMAAAVSSINSTEGFTLVDTDELTAVLDKNLVEGVLPSAQVMRDIASQAGVDLVIATQLDALDCSYRNAAIGDFVKLDLRGYVVSYNALTGKYKKGRIFDNTERDASVYARSDFEMEYWRDNIRHEMNRITGNKKLKVEKPRLGW